MPLFHDTAAASCRKPLVQPSFYTEFTASLKTIFTNTADISIECSNINPSKIHWYQDRDLDFVSDVVAVSSSSRTRSFSQRPNLQLVPSMRYGSSLSCSFFCLPTTYRCSLRITVLSSLSYMDKDEFPGVFQELDSSTCHWHTRPAGSPARARENTQRTRIKQR